ncbi:MAG: glycosyltransferase family 4 protein, partial [Bacteroidaceae bacterium]|nr:glycosyltransferase family 4 protein [Bacteroidaceae bacterium]
PLSRNIAIEKGLTDKRVFLFVGRLVALKNIETIIRAFARLNQKENVFVIVGDGPERNNLEKAAHDLNANVLFTGRLEGDTLNIWYNIADIFILASYQEAFGAVTNEALLGGCYALVSNKAGSSCLIEEGINGYTFSPMNIDELANRMVDACMFTAEYNTNGLKKNQMRISYSAYIENLIKTLS